MVETLLAASLDVSSPTVSRYIDRLADLLLVRRLPPLVANVGKRLVKSPKGLCPRQRASACLLSLRVIDDVLAHPVAGSSWEGFVVESLLAAAPAEASASFYRTAAGAEVDLVLDLGRRLGRWVIQIKRTVAPSVSRGLHTAIADLNPNRAFIVHVGDKAFPFGGGVEAVSLRECCDLLLRAR